MRKVIAAFNMTLDGISDHTAGIADEDLHKHYAELIDNSEVILYGRITYQLMQYWQTLLQNPSGEKSMDQFAVSIDNVHKIVFSRTLKETGWASAEIAEKPLNEVLSGLKQIPGKDILIGSKSLIIQLLNDHLIDEFQICIHPVIEGKGSLLFDKINKRIMLKLIKSKSLNSGAVIFYYNPEKG